jgi:MoaA/NifB/PqqE/SkfB family radical SAM enzyme
MQTVIPVPETLRIEPCTHCQLHCPGCPNMDLGHPPGMGWGRLKFEHFRGLIDANPEIRHVVFDCFGEVFLNKDILPMLEYGSARNLTFSFSSANFNHVPDAVLEGLVKHGVEAITVAFDGVTPETYAIYRKRGDLNRVLGNVRKLNAYKQQHQSERPRLVWLWVVFGHNQHEIPQAMALATELGMQFKPKMQWDSSYSPITDPEQLRITLGWEHSTRESYLSNTGDHYMKRVCHQLWQGPKINWDGKVLGCCWTQEGFGGNAFEDGYEAAINNEKIVFARRMLAGEAPARSDIPCTLCPLYQERLASGQFLTEDELKNPSSAG